MEIFGKHLFGSDAEQFLKLCKDKKKEWILKRTSQTDETLIDEFINNPSISKECKCMDCGKNKNKKDATISNGISEEVTTITEPIDNSIDNGGDSVKRPKAIKRGKN